MPKKTFAILFAFAFILMPMVSSGADGADNQLSIDSSSVNIGEFTEGSSGTISIPIENDTSGEMTVSIYVTWIDGSGNVPEDRIASVEGIKVPPEADGVLGKVTAEISFAISSPGKHHVKIWFQPDTAFPNSNEPFNWITAEINVSDSIWNNASTYILIIIVIIAVAVAVYLRVRSTRVPKSEGRFTAMEMERRAHKGSRNESAGAHDGTQTETSGAEKREYTGRKTKPSVKNASNRKSAKRRAK